MRSRFEGEDFALLRTDIDWRSSFGIDGRGLDGGGRGGGGGGGEDRAGFEGEIGMDGASTTGVKLNVCRINAESFSLIFLCSNDIIAVSHPSDSITCHLVRMEIRRKRTV